MPPWNCSQGRTGHDPEPLAWPEAHGHRLARHPWSWTHPDSTNQEDKQKQAEEPGEAPGSQDSLSSGVQGRWLPRSLGLKPLRQRTHDPGAPDPSLISHYPDGWGSNQISRAPWDGEPRPGAQPGPQQRPLEHFSQHRGPAQGIPKQQVVDRKRFRRGWRRRGGGRGGGRGGSGPGYVHSAVVSRWGWL